MHQIAPDEEMLIARAAAGDAEAFGALYQQYSAAIYRFILARVREPAEAEDLCGQVFLKAWEAMPAYEQRGHRFSSWLYQIAHNLVIDYYRSQPHACAVSLADDPALNGGQESTLDHVIANEESAAIASAIAELPPDQRRVIVLRFFRGLPHGEVARLLDKSQAACRVIQHRALTALNQTLSHYWLLATLTLILVGGSALYASETALPGDTLYPVKRSVETLRLAASLSDRSDALLHLDFAGKRLTEALRLAATARDADLHTALEAYRIELETAATLLYQEPTQWFGEVGVTLERYERQLNDLHAAASPAVRQMVEEARRTTRNLRAAAPLHSEPTPLPAPTFTPTVRIAVTATPVVPTPAVSVVVPLPSTAPDMNEDQPASVPGALLPTAPTAAPIPTAQPQPAPTRQRPPVNPPIPPVATPPDVRPPADPGPGNIPCPPDRNWPTNAPWPTGVPRPPEGSQPSNALRPAVVPSPLIDPDEPDDDAQERWSAPPDVPRPPNLPAPPRPPDPPNPPRPPDPPFRP